MSKVVTLMSKVAYHAKQISFALSVSLLNPHAIMDTIGVIGTSASAYDGSEKIAFTVATISVSWLWFIFLAIVVVL